MANITIEGFDELVEKLDRWSRKQTIDEIAKKAVDSAADIVVNATKAAIPSASVAASIQAIPARENDRGIFSVAKPTGRHITGRTTITNATFAAFLEYGTYKAEGYRLAPNPWRAKAAKSAEEPARKAMEETIKEEMELE